jgi:hypothetical protein
MALNAFLYSKHTAIVIISRRTRLAGHTVCLRDTRSTHIIFVGKIERKRFLGKPRHR